MRSTLVLALLAPLAFAQFPGFGNKGNGGGFNLSALRNFFNRGQQDQQRQEPRGSCNDQAVSAMNCAKDAFGMNEQSKRQNEQKMEQVKQEISQCFVDYGCQDPKPAYESFKQCVSEKLRNGVVEDFLQCADRRRIDIPPEIREKLENLGDNDGEHGGGMMMMGGRGRMGRGGGNRDNPIAEQIRILIEAKCPNDRKTRDAVDNCSNRAIEQAYSSSGSSMNPAAFFKVMGCKDELSCECQNDLSDRKDGMCECADEILQSRGEEEYRRQLEECRQRAGVDLGSEDAYGKVESMVKKFCGRKMPNFGC